MAKGDAGAGAGQQPMMQNIAKAGGAMAGNRPKPMGPPQMPPQGTPPQQMAMPMGMGPSQGMMNSRFGGAPFGGNASPGNRFGLGNANQNTGFGRRGNL